ncbi:MULTISPECIES: TatD family hydrolase [unclassified Methanoregula]|uniref:TatD family hydrolase n=1 Tax=unclassified Methanoregula TaxID=2649730 RepID=UPI0009C69EF2|nr:MULTISPECIES: TatD family hydrolase [unclassified Methanoregula]OPX65191.1 MAG: TatD related DNase [Methanoregula sp. PtaB.Bin085]OPY32100.1 MAG: TatD related DNase [Methanoregula sp. PtaU1.Bin006]
MKSPEYPVTDDHIHFNPRGGRGLEAAKDFLRAGGTHLFLVSLPSWTLGVDVSAGTDYGEVFDETLRIAEMIRSTGLTVFTVLGVHPAEMNRLAERMPVDEAAGLMMAGLDCAASYVREGKAVALKSGRPHYDVSPEMLDASNDVLSHALRLSAECGCALQIHAESGPCDDVVTMAAAARMPVERVVKHYASPDTPLHPSLIAKHDAVPQMVRERRRFTMESDYMDENSRPGAVTGPKSVPKYTGRLVAAGVMTIEDCYFIHKDTVERVYGVTVELK